ncbi:MAG: hypothetical protein R6V31_04560 [Halohasta sp.]
MSTTPAADPQPTLPADCEADLTEKQQRILAYLREAVDSQTYFKSRLIADELGLSAKEVGTNMPSLVESEVDLTIEKWGYSSGTTWMVTG